MSFICSWAGEQAALFLAVEGMREKQRNDDLIQPVWIFIKKMRGNPKSNKYQTTGLPLYYFYISIVYCILSTVTSP